MSEYTPTTDEIRNGYTPDMMIASERPYEEWKQIAFDEFDRWLAQHDEQIRTAAFQEGYRTGCEEQSGRDAYDAYDKGYWDAIHGEDGGFSADERAFHMGHFIDDSYRQDCRMCGGTGSSHGEDGTVMSDYTPTTTEDIYSCFDHGYRNRSKVSFSVAKIAFDSWLAQHDAAIRADEREQTAERIFNEEQVVNQVFWQDPTNQHLSGVLRGLQRARDIARGEDDSHAIAAILAIDETRPPWTTPADVNKWAFEEPLYPDDWGDK